MTRILAALAAALLTCAPAAAQSIAKAPAAAPLAGAERITATQGSGCATGVQPCLLVYTTPTQLGTFLAAALQAKDADLDAIAALATQPFGRSLLTQADAAAVRSALGLGTMATQAAASYAALTGAAFTGNVGIGTSSPTAKLHVVGQTRLDGRSFINRLGASDDTPDVPSLGSGYPTASLVLGERTGQYGLAIGVGTISGNTWLQVGRFAEAGAYNLNLQPAGGNVGIGTSSPQAKLHVVGDAKIEGNASLTAGFRHSGSTAARYEAVISAAPPGATGTGVEIGTLSGVPIISAVNRDNNTLTNLNINVAGIGIGTSSPAAKLHVAGDVRVDGDLIVSGTAWTTFAPTVGATSGTLASASAGMRYKQLGKTITYTVRISVATNGTAAGALTYTVPFPAAGSTASPVDMWTCAGRENATSGAQLQAVLPAGSSTVSVFRYDNQYPAANGSALYLTCRYEAQ